VADADGPEIAPLGDDALLVTFGSTISWETGLRARNAARCIRDARIPGVTDVVPAYTTVGVYFGANHTSLHTAAVTLRSVLAAVSDAERESSRHIEVPVVYDGADLQDVAERTGLSVDDVIRAHSERTYRAYVLGFLPGFAYLGDLDDALVLPRRATPRVRVPRGSVAIAGRQTAVYPFQTPGGWHLLGTTPISVFDPQRDPPALILPGDTVRFVATQP
jgi:KipI family sensor histidine kinase inhibitor